MFGGHFQTIFHSDIISVSGCTCVQLLDTSFLQLDIYRLYLTIINKWQLKNGNKHNFILLLNHTLQLKLYFFLFQQNITSLDCLVTVVFKKNEVSVITKLISFAYYYCHWHVAGVDVTAGPWPVYLRWGQSNWTKIGPLGQLIFSGHLGQQLSFLPCHSIIMTISTDNRLMKFPDKTLKFNFNHSPKAINSLIHTISMCLPWSVTAR
jgi:hypothetical protein